MDVVPVATPVVHGGRWELEEEGRWYNDVACQLQFKGCINQ